MHDYLKTPWSISTEFGNSGSFFSYFPNSLKRLRSFLDKFSMYLSEGFLDSFEKLCMNSTVFSNSVSLSLSPVKLFKYLSIQGFLPLSSSCE